MTRFTPETLARPLLGGPSGARLATGGPQHGIVGGVLAMCLLGVTTLLGVLLQAPCVARGWEQPFASFRMCASPLANGITATTFPDAPGRAPGASTEFSPASAWLVGLAERLGAGAETGDTAFFMVLVLLLNVLAIAAAGIALLLLGRSRGDRVWIPVAFVSPVIVFTLGQTLDPVGVALALWAVVLLRPAPSRVPRSPMVAGALLGLAAFINPLALVVVLALALVLVSRRETTDLIAACGAFIVAVGVLIVLDGRLFGRLAAWWAEAIDRGSVVSLLSYERSLDPGLLTAVSVIVWVLALGIACAVMLAGRSAAPLSLPAVATVLLGLSLLFMPAAPTWNALWLVPFAALAVRHLWVQVAWGLSEAALAAAVHLSDVTALDASEGLSPMWLSVFTLLRLFALAFLVYLATERLRAAPPARMSRDSTADAVSAAAGSDIASSVPGEGPGEGDTARPNH
ncbi:hypothetical protein NLM24_48025 [Nocardia zapadnayensis]|uniref:hypothetical protein n=1 Tax=Brevibacterium sp. R8603A2 TaxID=2929779 RepID=UPI001FFAF991|nr:MULTISPECIES: hypothetical protein [Actinomycetes]MCK1802297.1 hypothetical protein [Brevibacterium sp. R8603A2]MCX0278156.1 hypothetical protein [Nocardia zapadnayensis]